MDANPTLNTVGEDFPFKSTFWSLSILETITFLSLSDLRLLSTIEHSEVPFLAVYPGRISNEKNRFLWQVRGKLFCFIFLSSFTLLEVLIEPYGYHCVE